MMNKWHNTKENALGGGMAVKTMDCKAMERIIIEALEGKRENITEVIFGEQWRVKGYQKAYNDDGYEFIAAHESNVVSLDNWKYVCLEEWENQLLIHVTDHKPVDE